MTEKIILVFDLTDCDYLPLRISHHYIQDSIQGGFRNIS